MKPPRSILDPNFIYTPAVKTDIRATFDRIRKEQARAKALVYDPPVVVRPDFYNRVKS